MSNSKSSGVDWDHLQLGDLDFVAILIREVQQCLQPTSFHLYIKFIELADNTRSHKLIQGGVALFFILLLFFCGLFVIKGPFVRMMLQRRQCVT